ncbi:hypothetical protein HYY75_11010 [bacterium]|nr:hypothetical protein [bacterium]
MVSGLSHFFVWVLRNSLQDFVTLIRNDNFQLISKLLPKPPRIAIHGDLRGYHPSWMAMASLGIRLQIISVSSTNVFPRKPQNLL